MSQPIPESAPDIGLDITAISGDMQQLLARPEDEFLYLNCA
jgi:hypothetical protein